MDRISQLTEALLLRILSELPTTKDVVATMVLSKLWQPLWKSLILHEAPLETLDFKLTQESVAFDIGIWISIADKRRVRDLSIEFDCSSSATPVVLPRSLYTGCRMLVALELKSVTLADASSLPSFSTLKTLSLLSVKYPGDEFVRRLLSSCHVLEDLVVELCEHDNVTIFTVKVPSLKSASLSKSPDRCTEDEDGFVIDAASLEYLDIFQNSKGFCVFDNDILNISKATVVVDKCPAEILSSITSAKQLHICLPYSKDAYSVGSVFQRLVHLKICTCETEWLNLLMCVLRDSPNLRALELQQCHELRDVERRPCWNEPNSVPVCVLSSLETLKWVKYTGTEEEKEVASFILRSGSCLKKVTISSISTDSDKKLEMLKELSLSIRRSPTCQLEFA